MAVSLYVCAGYPKQVLHTCGRKQYNNSAYDGGEGGGDKEAKQLMTLLAS